jgi:tetratricopeptide (TPR) repeat protein
MEVGNYHLSESFFKRSINVNPSFYHNFNNLGNLYFKQKKYLESIQYYSQAIKFDNQPDFIFNRAKAFIKLDKPHQAEKDLANIPTNYYTNEFVFFKIDLLLLQNKFQLALDLISSLDFKFKSLQEIIQKKIIAEINLLDLNEAIQSIGMLKCSDTKNFYLGLYKFKKFNYEEAISLFEKAKSHPNFGAQALNNLGLIYRDTGRVDMAITYFEQAISKDSSLKQAKINKAVVLLRNKNFKEGWKFYKSRYKSLPGIIMGSALTEYEYDSLPGEECLIVYEQGLGDQFFFLQLLNNQKLPSYSFLIDERLLSLYSERYPKFNFYSIKFIEIDLDKFKHYFFIADLFAQLIPDEKSIQSILLKFPQNNCKPRILNSSKKLTIGISWKTSDKYASQVKNISLNEIIESFSDCLNSFQFLNLQYGDIESDILSLSSNNKKAFLDSKTDVYNDIEGLTNLIRDCDFIITIGNITAHIAGSIGKPCFVIEPRNFQTIWYWHNGGRSLWYPNTNIQFFENDRNIKYCLDEIKKLIKSN